MKKLFGEGGFMGFLSRHCEKMVFGLAVLIVIWVAVPSSEFEPYPEAQKGPSVINDKASGAQEHLRTLTWNDIYEERYKTEDRYLIDSKDDLKRVLVSGYPAPVPLNKPNFPQDRLRQDPYIAPIEDLAVSVAYGAVAMNDPDAGDGRGTGGSVGGGEIRPFPPEVEEFVQQFGTLPAGGAKLESRFIVSVTGLVPVRKHKGAFQATFNETAGFSELRDTTPVYGAFEGREGTYGRDCYLVERAEVMPDGSIGKFATGWGGGELEKHKFGTRIAKYVQKRWAGGDGTGGAQPAGSNFPDPRYVDPRFAMNVPPLMLRDLATLANHRGVPTAAEAREDAAAEPAGGDELDGLDGPTRDRPSPSPLAPSHRRPMVQGEAGVGDEPVDEEIEYLLFRYYDMAAEPGKSYVYRAKILMEDPNFPMDPTQRPETRTLAPEVIERLNRREKQTTWWRESEYSQNSSVARVPDPQRLLAGPVVPPKTRHDEKTAQIMALIWDNKKAMDVPGVLDASRGSVVNFENNVEAIDLSAGGLRELSGYPFKTDNILLDLRGGGWFTSKKNQAVPGEILLMDEKGNLIVHSELEDAKVYGDHIYPAASAGGTGPIPDGPPGLGERPPRGGDDVDIFGR